MLCYTFFMASISKNPGCKIWFASYRDANGKQHRRTTKTTNRIEARKLADIFERVSRRMITARGMREILVDMYRQESGITIPTSTVEEFAMTWLANKRTTMSPAGFGNYERVLRKFLRFIGELSKADLGTILKQHLVGFRDFLASEVGPVTTNKQFNVITLLFQEAARDGFLSENPALHVGCVKIPKKKVHKAFTKEQLSAILAVATGEMRSLILFGIYTGQRMSDLATLRWSALDLEQNTVRFYTAKTNTSITIPMAPALREHVMNLPAGDDPESPLHPRYCKLHKHSQSNLSMHFAELLSAVGLRASVQADEVLTGKRKNRNALSFHSLRYTAVTLLKEAGIPEAVVRELIGHKSKEISDHYTDVGIDALRAAANALPRL
jgi:integrase